MILPRGVTGFNVPKRQPTPDPPEFLGDCWRAALAAGGRIDDRPRVPAGYGGNFVAYTLVLPDAEGVVLLNCVHPWVAFCRPFASWGVRLEFTEPGGVGVALAEPGRYRVLTLAELEQPVVAAMTVELRHGELAQMKYWAKVAGSGKLRVGDVVFNCWD